MSNVRFFDASHLIFELFSSRQVANSPLEQGVSGGACAHEREPTPCSLFLPSEARASSSCSSPHSLSTASEVYDYLGIDHLEVER